MRFFRLYIIVVCLCSGVVLLACVSFLSLSYESLIHVAIAASKKPYLENTLRNSIFTAAKFFLLRSICIGLLCTVLPVACLLILYRRKVLYALHFAGNSLWQVCTSFIQVFRQNNRQQNLSVWLVIILVIARSLYYITQYDLQYDEMWSYNYFTAQPFYYPFVVSSNYPLFEISTGLFKWLPFDMKVNIRLPVLLAGIAACITVYACMRRYYGSHFAAWGAAVLFAFMPVTTFYMLYARGVMFNLFFAAIAVFSALFWLKNRYLNKYLVVYALANAAAFYSMPTHLYLWAILFLLLGVACFFYAKSKVKHLLFANVAGAVIGFVCYAPMLAGSGLSYLLNSSVDTTSAPQTAAEILSYNWELSSFFTGFNYGFAILLLLAALVFTITNTWLRYLFLFSLCAALCLFPSFICAVQNIQVPSRALGYIGLCIPLLGSAAISVLMSNHNKQIVMATVVCAGTGVAFISHFHHYLNWSRQKDKEVKAVSALLMQHGVVTLFDSSSGSGFGYYYPALEYYYRSKNKPFVLNTDAVNSLRYKVFSANDQYDCIVFHLREKVNIVHYKELYTDKASGFKILVRQ